MKMLSFRQILIVFLFSSLALSEAMARRDIMPAAKTGFGEGEKYNLEEQIWDFDECHANAESFMLRLTTHNNLTSTQVLSKPNSAHLLTWSPMATPILCSGWLAVEKTP